MPIDECQDAPERPRTRPQSAIRVASDPQSRHGGGMGRKPLDPVKFDTACARHDLAWLDLRIQLPSLASLFHGRTSSTAPARAVPGAPTLTCATVPRGSERSALKPFRAPDMEYGKYPDIRALQLFRCAVPGVPGKSGQLPRGRFFAPGRSLAVLGPVEGLRRPRRPQNRPLQLFGAPDLWVCPSKSTKSAGPLLGPILRSCSPRIDFRRSRGLKTAYRALKR